MRTKNLILFLLLMTSIKGMSQKSLSSLAGEMILVEVDTFTYQRGESRARITRCPMNYYISKYEVTQGLWKEVIGKNPSNFSSCGMDCPLEVVDWYQAMVFCNELSERLGIEPCYYEDANYTKVYGKLANGTYDYSTEKNPEWKLRAKGYRLPLEVEWEYAARGGKRSRGYEYSGSNDVNAVAWYQGNNTPYGTKPVGKKLPNEIGIYDMSGNVSEWCYDSYADFDSPNGYDACSKNGKGKWRVIRSGPWYTSANFCQVSFRNYYSADTRLTTIGFRLCRTQ